MKKALGEETEILKQKNELKNTIKQIFLSKK